MLLKKFLCLLLVFAFTVMSLASCAGNGETQTSADIITTTIGTTSTTQAAATTQTTVTTVTTEKPQDPVLSTQSEEVLTAQELGLIPSNWASDLTKSASFGGFYTMMVRLIELCDESCADEWEAAIDQKNYPARAMLRDDALVMITIAAEILGYNSYNINGNYGFYLENIIDFEKMFSDLSDDYPYCEASRVFFMYRENGTDKESILGAGAAAVYFFQRRMDLYTKKYFLDYDNNYDFKLSSRLTREDAIKAVVRFYNSTIYNEPVYSRTPTEADENILAGAEKLKQTILNNTESVPCTGKAYYVSNSGNDKNNGLSPETAWKTLDKVNSAKLNRGDGVYFERGGLWRGQLIARDGVTYSAYGEGEKPKLYASPENGSGKEKWSLLEGTDNIWVYYKDMMDCGLLVFNEGEKWGAKVTPYYKNGYLSTINKGQPFDVKSELTEDLMFFSKADSVLNENGQPFLSSGDYNDGSGTAELCVGKLYLRCDSGNPGEIFESIEFMVRLDNVVCAKDNVFNNICFKYTGGTGIVSYYTTCVISFCEFGWMGGCIWGYDINFMEDGTFSPGGGALGMNGNTELYSVTDCYFYQHLDAALSHQATAPVQGTGDVEPLRQRNITYARNVVEYTDMPVEIFYNLRGYLDDTTYMMENVLVEDNYFLYTGYGWGSQLYKKSNFSSAYMGHWDPNAAKNFKIINNVFYLSTGPLITTAANLEYLPVLDGNTYVQNELGVLAIWRNDDNEVCTYPFEYSEKTVDIIKNILKDKNAKVIIE